MNPNDLYRALIAGMSEIPGESARSVFFNRCNELAEMLQNPEYGSYEKTNIGNAFITAATKYNLVGLQKFSVLASKYYKEINEFFPELVNEWRSGNNSSEDFINKSVEAIEKICVWEEMPNK